MRTLIVAVVFTVLLAAFCPPLPAQGTQPVFLILLEGKGVPTGTIHVFSVDSLTGALTEVPGSPFNAGLVPQYLVVDPTGRFLYVANLQSQDITGFSIDASTGALTVLAGSPYSIASEAQAMGIDPTGRFLYVSATTAQGSSLYDFTIDGASGVLTPAQNSPQRGIFATSIVFDPIGNYAYLSTGSPGPGSSSPILVCSINFTDGTLTPVSAGQPAAGGSNAAAVSPSGGQLYSIDPVTSRLDAFAASSGGLFLGETSGSPYPVPLNPYSLVVHPSGNFLYVASENQPYQTNYAPSQYNGSISAFTITPGAGTLAPVAGSPFAAGINPLSIVVEPTGRFAYSTSTTYTSGYTGFAQIRTFSIDSSTGVLTPLAGTPWTDSAQGTGVQLAFSKNTSTTTNPVPMISSLSPPSTTATAVAFTLQVNGDNFVPGATVYFGGQARFTTFVSSTQLNASIPGSDIKNGGTAVVFVFNPRPGGGPSTSVEFPVFNPSPVISSLLPSSVTAGVTSFSFAVIGSNFVSSSVISFNGTPLPTAYANPTIVTAAIPVSLISAAGTASITVTNPSNGVPGGGTSNAATLTILPPKVQPVVTGISPTGATAGGPAFTLTVNGTGFVPGSQVTFNLNNVPTTLVSATQLTASIPASAIALAGNPYVIVNNPGGLASAQLNFTVSDPQPGGGSVSPPSLPVGSNELSLNVTGTGFTQNSVVLVNGASRVTLFVSSTQLQATLLSADLTRVGTLPITVMNPPPGGGTTQAISFAVTDFSVTPPASAPPVAAGRTARFALTVSPVDGAFPDAVTFSISSSTPPLTGTTASFSPSNSVTPGSTPQTVTLSITTTAHTATSRNYFPRGSGPIAPIAGLMGVVLALVGLWLRNSRPRLRRLAPQCLMALLVVTAAGLAACGAVGSGTSSSPQLNPATGTAAGNYSIAITATTSGGVSHPVTVTLTVM